MINWLVKLPTWAWRALVVIMIVLLLLAGTQGEKADSAEPIEPRTINITVTIIHHVQPAPLPEKRGEVIVSEQFLDEGPLDVRRPAMLSFWPDLSRDDGTLGAAIYRCQNQGGEMIAEFLEGDWQYKCEDVDI